jgi:hypothetical protein
MIRPLAGWLAGCFAFYGWAFWPALHLRGRPNPQEIARWLDSGGPYPVIMAISCGLIGAGLGYMV